MRRHFEWGLLGLALYSLSLVTPCVITQKLFGGGTETEPGIACLLLGWFTIPWYANPFLLFAAIANAFRAHEVAFIFSVTALIAALTLFGYSTHEVEPHVGYFIWLASIVAIGISSIVRMHDRDDKDARERELLTLMHEASRDP
ncbi:MAG: hypothetical protein ABJE66_34600 [Deltaproteobacteria bacterium]